MCIWQQYLLLNDLVRSLLFCYLVANSACLSNKCYFYASQARSMKNNYNNQNRQNVTPVLHLRLTADLHSTVTPLQLMNFSIRKRSWPTSWLDAFLCWCFAWKHGRKITGSVYSAKSYVTSGLPEP